MKNIISIETIIEIHNRHSAGYIVFKVTGFILHAAKSYENVKIFLCTYLLKNLPTFA